MPPAAEQAADLLFPAWRDPSRLIPGLPEALRPTDEAQSYAIQAAGGAAAGRDRRLEGGLARSGRPVQLRPHAPAPACT